MDQYLADFHFHSLSSPDSTESLENHLLAGEDRGLSELCITDHWDLVDDPSTLNPPLDLWQKRQLKAQATVPHLPLRFGIEVGDGYADPPLVHQVLAQLPLDFVLGSVHAVNRPHSPSIYWGFPKSQDRQEHLDFFHLYFKTLLLQSQQDYFDSLGHIIYPFRYLRYHQDLSPQLFLEEITLVLEELIRQDKSFELNTTQGRTLEIWTPILKRYRDLGGQNLTLGSDAHQASHLGLGLTEALDLLKSVGFSHYLVYRQRQKVEIPIL